MRPPATFPFWKKRATLSLSPSLSLSLSGVAATCVEDTPLIMYVAFRSFVAAAVALLLIAQCAVGTPVNTKLANDVRFGQSFGPPTSPPWPSPYPAFGSSWFGGNMKGFEWENPAELDALRKYKAVLTGWMELLTVSNFTNSTKIAQDQVGTGAEPG